MHSPLQCIHRVIVQKKKKDKKETTYRIPPAPFFFFFNEETLFLSDRDMISDNGWLANKETLTGWPF